MISKTNIKYPTSQHHLIYFISSSNKCLVIKKKKLGGGEEAATDIYNVTCFMCGFKRDVFQRITIYIKLKNPVLGISEHLRLSTARHVC